MTLERADVKPGQALTKEQTDEYLTEFVSVANETVREKTHLAIKRGGLQRMPDNVHLDFSDFARPAILLVYEGGPTLRVEFDMPQWGAVH